VDSRVLLLASRPNIVGPIPKIVPLQIAMLRERGCSVDVAYWGSRFDREPTLHKLIAGPADLAKALHALSAESYDVVFVNTSHDAKTLLRDMPLLWLTRHRNVRRVLLLHGSSADRLVRRGNRWFKLASRFVALSADVLLVLYLVLPSMLVLWDGWHRRRGDDLIGSEAPRDPSSV